MIDTAIILCTRFDSSRIFQKPFQIVGNKMLIEHLCDRLAKTGLNIYLAVPTEQYSIYKQKLLYYLAGKSNIYLLSGHKMPLNRMRDVARYYKIQNIIRVCHDKIFVNHEIVKHAIDVYKEKQVDYLYSSGFIDGTGFEIISFKALNDACDQFKNVEHVSYAVKSVTKNTHNLNAVKLYKNKTYGYHTHFKMLRLLIDYPKDLELIRKLIDQLGNDATIYDVLKHIFYLNIKYIYINQLPKVTVYTCAFNSQKHIKECIDSVLSQELDHFEYIVVDDYSIDDTKDILNDYNGKLKVIYNKHNYGLASSSNIALENARGKYIIRLDADDYFSDKKSLHRIYKHILEKDCDVIYPNNYFGSEDKIQWGNKCHHVGGAIFNKRAINSIKFTDSLRGYEGLDFFERSKDALKIGYLNDPIFFYRQTSNSLSKTNLKRRKLIREMIKEKKLGNDLIKAIA